ncbi:MAG: hypothetical protein GY679_01810 [Mycoplasma sp.]|nr:hypothetical protein [Mycoplasma sp.]
MKVLAGIDKTERTAFSEKAHYKGFKDDTPLKEVVDYFSSISRELSRVVELETKRVVWEAEWKILKATN